MQRVWYDIEKDGMRKRENDDSNTLMSENWIKNLHFPCNGLQAYTCIGVGGKGEILNKVYFFARSHEIPEYYALFPHASDNNMQASKVF